MTTDSETESLVHTDDPYTSGRENSTRMDSLVEQATRMLLFKCGVYLDFYYFPVMVFLGLLGNTLSFLVMLQKWNRSTSCCVYMLVLAVTDTGVLLSYFSFWLDGVILHRAKWFGCRFATMMFSFCSNVSIWLVTFVTMDRYLAICFPLKFHNVRTTRFAKRLIAAMSVLMLGINSIHMYTSRLLNPSTCAVYMAGNLVSKVFSYLQVSVNSIGPYIVVFTLNVFIIHTMKRRSSTFNESNRKHLAVTASNSKSYTNNEQRAERSLAVMLLSISFAFLCLTLPQFVRYFVYSHVNYKASPASYALYVLMYNISNKMYMTNNAINFYLYCMSGPKFRRDVVVLFKCSSGNKPMIHSSSAETVTSNVV